MQLGWMVVTAIGLGLLGIGWVICQWLKLLSTQLATLTLVLRELDERLAGLVEEPEE